jgi:hypothetical protein
MRVLPILLLGLLVTTSAVPVDAKPYLRKPKRGIQMRTAPYVVGPGEDREWCEYRRLPITKPMDVTGFKVRMPDGAHHFVIWGYSGTEQDDSKFPQEPVESVGCAGVGPGEVMPRVVIPLQSPNQRFDLPKGIALRLEPGEQVWLNSHLKNLSDAPVTPDVRFNFYAAKPGTIQHHAEGLIVGNMAGIDVPAGGDQTITAEWTAPLTVNLVYLATHQHRLGTYANIELVGSDGAISRIYENNRWEHPRNFWPAKPIRLAKGDKMRITCTWHNTDPQPVRFGPNTTDEMCFILGFYYRDDGDTEAVGFGQCLPATSGLLCPLAPLVD